MKLKMVDYAKVMLPNESEIQTVLNSAYETPKTALQLIEKIEPNRQAFVLRSLAWLMKLGVLKLNP
jgi:pyridoxal/pyridoxine/pyridoxamine kinase